MVATYILSTRARAGAVFSDEPRQLTRGLSHNGAEGQVPDPGSAVVANPQKVVNEVNRGRQAA